MIFPGGAQGRELIQRRAAALGWSARHDDAGPFHEESAGRGQADPAGPSDDQTSAAIEPAGT